MRAVFGLLDRLPRRLKNRLRGGLGRARNWWVDTFRSYGPAELAVCLRSLGIREGDILMLHSAYKESSGFKGSPGAVAECFLQVLGESGNLLMVSLPTTGASYEYLGRTKVFDVRRTPSRMGLVSEFFRRRDDVVRSLHPSHPVLAHGPQAQWIVEGHESCLFPCGPDTPFDRAVELDGKLVFFDCQLNKMTFFHWLEHRIQDRVDLPLYGKDLFEVRVVDQHGKEAVVRTYAFSKEAIQRRRAHLLHDELWKRGLVRRGRIGNTEILVVNLRDIIRCVDEMADRGVFFYELS